MQKIMRVLAVCAALGLLVAPMDAFARAGGGAKSMGSRGARTYQQTPTYQAKPIERSVTPPPAAARPAAPQPTMAPNMARPAAAPMPVAAPASTGFFGSPFVRGLAGGFLGAGLFSMFFGHGTSMAGTGDMAAAGGAMGGSGMLGLLLQFALIGGLIYFGIKLFRRSRASMPTAYEQRQQDSYFEEPVNPPVYGNGYGAGEGPSLAVPPLEQEAPDRGEPLAIEQNDYAAFQEALEKVQVAWGRADIMALRAFVTPEMLSYFNEMLSADASRSEMNKVEQVKFLAGDLVEAWREESLDYATVRMKWSSVDYRVRLDRAVGASDYVVDGSPTEPVTAIEIWTFARAKGGRWLLSAIQQVA